MSQPVFSIIIPLYNKEKQIANTIESVLLQAFDNYEIIIVNDGSTDNSEKIVKQYDDPRIRYYYQINGGVSSARNSGLSEACGEWIILLDADDILSNNALEKWNKAITDYSDTDLFVGKYTGSCQVVRHNLSEGHIRYLYLCMWSSRLYIRPGSFIIKRESLDKNNLFDTRMSFFEDYEFALRIASSCKTTYINDTFVEYKQESAGLSSTPHPIEKDMAYYIPEMRTYGFWHKALLYENLQLTMFWWEGHEKELMYYEEIENKYFGTFWTGLHWIRQKMVRWGII